MGQRSADMQGTLRSRKPTRFVHVRFRPMRIARRVLVAPNAASSASSLRTRLALLPYSAPLTISQPKTAESVVPRRFESLNGGYTVQSPYWFANP